MNVPFRLDAIKRLFGRASDPRRSMTLKVSLPDARVWLRTAGRAESLVYERRTPAGWEECTRDELTDAQYRAITLFVVTDGMSADPRVAGATFHVFENRWRITYADTAHITRGHTSAESPVTP